MSGCGSPKGTAITVDLSNLTPSQVVSLEIYVGFLNKNKIALSLKEGKR